MSSTEIQATKRTKRIAEDAGKQAAREAIMEMQFGDDNDPSEAARVDQSTEALADKRDVGFDIFESIGFPLSKQGVTVRYTIKKNNELAGVKKHPYSWLDVAKDYGYGDFQVIAKDNNKKYLSSQNQTISEDADVFNHIDDEDEKPAQTSNPQNQIGWQQPGMSFLEMFNVIQSQSDRARSEAGQQAQLQAQSQVGMITAMTEMMKNQQLQGQTMFMEMSKMTAAVAEKMASTQEKIMEKLNARMDKLAESATKKPEGPGWMEIMKMQADSQNKGFELFEKITRLAELKADEKVELLESGRENGGGEEKKKSMTDSLIESLLPVITASMLNNNQSQQLALAQANARPLQAPQPRRSVQPQRGVASTPFGARPIQPQQRNSAPRTQAPHQGQATTAGRNNSGNVAQGGRTDRESTIIPKNSGPLIVDGNLREQGPVVQFKNLEQPEKIKAEERLADKVEVTEFESAKAVVFEHDAIGSGVRDKCKEVLPLFLGQMMLESVPANLAAEKTLSYLEQQGVSRDNFREHVTLEDLSSVAAEFDLPNEAHEWLNELYANIQDAARHDVREQTASHQHETTIRS